jgi:phage shock protein E
MILKLKALFIFMFAINSIALTVIDVRTLEEWNSGHLENAIHKEWQTILDISPTIPKDETIYLYCRSGNRSAKAANILIKNGYLNAINAGSIIEASKLLNTKIIK